MKTHKLEHTNDLWALQTQPDWLENDRLGIPNPSSEALVVLEQQGFKVSERSIRSVKILEQPMDVVMVRQLEQQGYEFKSLLELGDSGLHREKLYWLVRGAVENDPAFEGKFETFDQFNAFIWSIYWNNANGVFIALHNSDWVSMSGVHLDRIVQNGVATTLAGTAQDHRGLGLVQALKTLAINEAIKCGLTEIRTSNDSRNTAMLAINKKLGFVENSQFVWFAK
jgi:RimJ/RimL family protein N-acetyltransferase